MKILLLVLLFAPIVYLAAKEKKWYLCLLFAFIGVLPEHFAFAIHDKLPLISVTRILIMVVFVYWLYSKWKTKKISLPISIMIFLGVNLLISFVNFRYGFSEINRIFLFVFERVLVVVMVADLVEDRSEFERCLDFMIMSCVAMAVIGMVQTVFNYDIASVLYLSDRMPYTILTPRMGMTRAYATFNAISYGCYGAVMALVIYYRLEQTGKRWYTFAFAMNAAAILCTFSRSSWLSAAGIFFLLLLIRRRKLVHRLLPSAGLFIVICAVLCVMQPKIWSGLSETFKSSVNTVIAALPGDMDLGFNDADHDNKKDNKPSKKPEFELSDDFGLNADDPTRSRMVEWTAVDYMIEEGQLMFGYGYNAYLRGRLHYYYPQFGGWITATTLDVGLLSLVTESGLVGTLAMFGLLGFILWESFRRKDRSHQFDYYKMMIYMIPLYLLLNFLAAFLQTGTMWLIFALFYAYRKLDKAEALEAAEEQPVLEEKK